jgi:ribosomal protein S21
VEKTYIKEKTMSKCVNVEVTLEQAGGNVSRLIKRFIKKVKKERIIEDYLEKSRYVKPSEKRRRKKQKNLQNARKAQQERDRKLSTK